MTDMADLYKALGTGLGDGSAARYRRMRQLKNLKIAEVSSVDKGASPGARVMLVKRDDWLSPQQWAEEKAMQKSHNPADEFDSIVSAVRDGKIGKNVAHIRLKAWHDKHGFDRDRRDPRGRSMSDVQQFQDFLEGTPQGRLANQAMVNGLTDTHEELQAEAHKHSGVPSNERDDDTDPVGKAAGMARVIRKAADMIDRCVREYMPEADGDWGKTYDLLFAKSPTFRTLCQIEKFARLGVA